MCNVLTPFPPLPSLLRLGNSNEKTKPNLEQKALLDKIVNSPLGVQQLTGAEKDTLYIYRYALTENKKSLVKFLLSIDWDVTKETEEVAKLLPLWQRNAPLDVAEALKLLGKERAFQNEMVRAYAVECVDAATGTYMRGMRYVLCVCWYCMPCVCLSHHPNPSLCLCHVYVLHTILIPPSVCSCRTVGRRRAAAIPPAAGTSIAL